MQFLAHLFFPRSSNNYKAKIIRPSGIFSLLALFLICQVLVSHLPGGSVLGLSADFTPEEIITQTNKKRQELGLSELRTDDALTLSARAKGEDMLAKDYWAHVSPNGGTPWSFFTGNGYQYKYAGENLARDFEAPKDVVNAWLESPTHRENLLSSKYQDIGVAVVSGDFGGKPIVIVVQHFGTKLGVVTPAEITKHIQSVPVAVAEVGQTRGAGISQFAVKKNMAVAILAFLMLVLTIDAVVIYNLRVVRISGRSLAHFGFFASLIVFLILITKGSII